MSHLTGNTRFRMGWRGKLVLQVEVDHDSFDAPFGCWWRDANLFDLQELSYKLETQMPPHRHPNKLEMPAVKPPRDDGRPRQPPPASPQIPRSKSGGYVPTNEVRKPRKKRKEQHP